MLSNIEHCVLMKSYITTCTFRYCCTIWVLVRNDGAIRPRAMPQTQTIAKNNHEAHSGPHRGGHTKGKLVGCLVAVEMFRNVVWRI